MQDRQRVEFHYNGEETLKGIKLFFFISILLFGLFMIYAIFSAIFAEKHSSNDWGMMPTTPYITNKGFWNNFHINLFDYELRAGWMRIDSSLSTTAEYVISKRYQDGHQAYIIIGYLDYLKYYDDFTTTIDPNNCKRKYGYIETSIVPDTIMVRVVMPYAPFITAKVIPDGNYMIISGLHLQSKTVIKHVYVTEHRYTGFFNQIGFSTNNRSWFRRNVSRYYLFNGLKEKQYGSISIFIDKNNVRSFMIFCLCDTDSNDFKTHFSDFTKSLTTMQMLGSRGEYAE
jgi:hypothetical protein